MEGELLKAIISAGGGVAIAIVVLVGVYQLANKFAIKFIRAQEDQAAAVNRLTDTLEKIINRDQNDHREMIILQKVMMEKLERLENTIEDGRKERAI